MNLQLEQRQDGWYLVDPSGEALGPFNTPQEATSEASNIPGASVSYPFNESDLKTLVENGQMTVEEASEWVAAMNGGKDPRVIQNKQAAIQKAKDDAQIAKAKDDPAGALAGLYGEAAQREAEKTHEERLGEQQEEFAWDPRDAVAAAAGGLMSRDQAIALMQQDPDIKSKSQAEAEFDRILEGGTNKDGSLSSDFRGRVNSVAGKIGVSQQGAISGALGGLGQGDQLGATTTFPVLGNMPLLEGGAGQGEGEPAGPATIEEALDAQYQRIDRSAEGMPDIWQTENGRIVSYDGGRSYIHEFIDPESGQGRRASVGFSKKAGLSEGQATRSHAVTRLAMSPDVQGFSTQPFANVEGESLQNMLEGITGLELQQDLPENVDLFSEFDPAKSKYTMTPAADRSVLAQTLDNLGLRRAALADALGRSPTGNEMHNLGSVRSLGLKAEPMTARNLAALQQTGLLYSKPRANPDMVMQPLAQPGDDAATRAYNLAVQQLGGQVKKTGEGIPAFQTGGSMAVGMQRPGDYQNDLIRRRDGPDYPTGAGQNAIPEQYRATTQPQQQSNAEAAIALQPFGDFDVMNRAEQLIFEHGGGDFLANEFAGGNRIESTSELYNREGLPYSVQQYINAIQQREMQKHERAQGFQNPQAKLSGLLAGNPVLKAEFDRLNLLKRHGGADNLANIRVGLTRLLQQLLGPGASEPMLQSLLEAGLGMAGGGQLMTDEPIVGIGMRSQQPKFVAGEAGPEMVNVEPMGMASPYEGAIRKIGMAREMLGMMKPKKAYAA